MEKVGALCLHRLPSELISLLNQTSSARLLLFLQTLTTFLPNTHYLHAETYGCGSRCVVFLPPKASFRVVIYLQP